MEPNQFKLHRHFDAPRNEVFTAFTDERVFIRWFGAEKHQVEECLIDAVPGGMLRLVLSTPDGIRYPVEGKFTIVDPYEHLAFSLSAFPVPGGEFGLEYSIALTFASGEHITKLEFRFELLKARPEHMMAASDLREVWERSFDRLKQYLERREN